MKHIPTFNTRDILEQIGSSRSSDDAHLLLGKLDGIIYRRENVTEAYVCVPPALLITDSTGAAWTLGTDMIQHGWIYEFNVLRNDVDVGEMASKIEYQRSVVRIFGQNGWRTWSRSGKCFI